MGPCIFKSVTNVVARNSSRFFRLSNKKSATYRQAGINTTVIFKVLAMAQLNTKTPAMVLQEFTVKHGYSPPEYILVLSKTGTHENEFHYKVNVANINGTGFGRSKQVAKHNAATKALELLANMRLYDPASNPAQEFNAQSHRNESDNPSTPPRNFIGELKDICFEYKLPPPIFVEISDVGPPHCRQFTYECKVSSVMTQQTANTKKQAKQLAARVMVDKIKDICPELAEQYSIETNALTAADQEAIERFDSLSLTLGVTPNRSLEVRNYPDVIKRLMQEKDIKLEDFQEQFLLRDESSLNYICSTLGITYEIRILQQFPKVIIAILFGVEAPFTMVAMGEDEIDAKDKLIEQTFIALNVYMNSSDCDF